MTRVRLAAREFRESLRNYWFWVNSAVFLGGGLVLVLFGQPDATVLGYRGVARSLAGLMQLALFVVPLMALFPSAAAVAGEREVGTLDYLLAQPVTRGEVFAGKWLGVAAAVLLSLTGGFAVVGGAAVARGMPAGLLGLLTGLAAMLALTFVSIGTWISAATSTQGRATSLGLTAWLFFLALGSLGLMGGFVAWGVPAAALEAWAFANPVEAFRMAMIVVLDPGLEMLGPVGADLAGTLGSGALLALSVGSLAAWTAGAFATGRRTFRSPGPTSKAPAGTAAEAPRGHRPDRADVVSAGERAGSAAGQGDGSTTRASDGRPSNPRGEERSMDIGIREGSTLALALALVAACGGGEGGDQAAAASASETSGDRAEVSTSVDAMGESGMTGSLRVTRAEGGGVTVKLEVLGVESGTTYPVSLRRGACGSEGEQVAELDPPTVAQVGLGSSLTEVPADRMEAGETYAVRVDGPDGSPVACGQFEAPGG